MWATVGQEINAGKFADEAVSIYSYLAICVNSTFLFLMGMVAGMAVAAVVKVLWGKLFRAIVSGLGLLGALKHSRGTRELATAMLLGPKGRL